ncbi:hypothetical protein SCH01S_04_00080 [Sphingomonas changbaiensis NBRC 104936]|uniref:Uncharacterized protein n=1 Tax=Sphingomonas changbaiensis NBRC 104936 TaxID=1219043 RepID=A0A0E9MKQ6_9SPHN|nr:hypothetical protein [Sphingomonas changbaiensis]GAO38124.1 hypothetical protein SCH01S_04_00080 [Sphingomonas changbaiensis NBRC 104936]
MADETQARVYGMPDPANRDPVAPEGMRGDRVEVEPRRRDPDLSHKVMLETGNTVTLDEGSGVAYAEATGRAGLAEAKPWRDTRVEDEPGTGTSAIPLLAGLAIAAGVVAFALWRYRDHRPDVEREIDFRPAPELDL